MESQLAIDPDPEPPSYKIHQEKRGRHTVWVITQNNKFITVLSQRNLAYTCGFPPPGSPTLKSQLLTSKDQ